MSDKPQPWIGFFSEAPWLNRDCVALCARFFVVYYIGMILQALSWSPHLVAPDNQAIGPDFMNVWTAGKLALAGKAAAAYDHIQQYALQKTALPWHPDKPLRFFPWVYPPVFMLVAAPLACFSYGVALALWMLMISAFYLLAVRAILPGREAMIAALAFPGFFLTLVNGQNGCLTAALFGFGLVLLERRQLTAGVFIGLLAYKPQFGLLIPLALLADGRWRAIIAAGAAIIAAALASTALFGAGIWRAFFASLGQTRDMVLDQGFTGFEKMQSAFAAVRLMGGSIDLACVVQALVTLAIAAAVIRTWRKPVDIRLKSAILVTASLMATPYVVDYDLAAMVLPLTWLAALGIKEGFRPWEKAAMLAVWFLPLVSRIIGGHLHVPLAPPVMGLFMYVLLRRVLEDGKKTGMISS